MSETSISLESPSGRGTEFSMGNNIFTVDKPLENEKGNKTRVTFVYACHIPEYFEQIWQQCKDADLILLENVSEPGDRDFAKTIGHMNQSMDSTHPQVQQLKRQFEGSTDILEFFFSKILGTGKMWELIDVDVGSPEEIQLKSYVRMWIDIEKLVDDGLVKEAVGRYPEMIEAGIKANESRERKVLQQLKERLLTSPPFQRIAVIQGADHTPIYHEFRKLEFPVDTEMKFAPHRIVYPPSAILARRKRFFPKRKISEGDYFRACVGETIIARGIEELNAYPIVPKVEWFNYINRLIGRLSDGEIGFIARYFEREQKKTVTKINRYSQELSPPAMQALKHFNADKVAALTLCRFAKKYNIKINLSQIISMLYRRFRDGMFILPLNKK